MIIGGEDLRTYFTQGWWKVFFEDDPDTAGDIMKLQVGVNGVDVTLSNKFLKPASGVVVDLRQPLKDPKPVESNELILCPGDRVIGCTQQRFETPNYELFGKSFPVAQSFHGRYVCDAIGLQVGISSIGDVGFDSPWSFTLQNVTRQDRIRVRAGDRIGQVQFHCVVGALDMRRLKNDHQFRPKAPELGHDRF